MSDRDELKQVIVGYFGPTLAINAYKTPQQQDDELTDAILAAGYSKPKVLGYIVVDRGGVMVGNQHKHEESAQAFAAEWTKDCQDAGIDWDYRVAAITEAAA